MGCGAPQLNLPAPPTYVSPTTAISDNSQLSGLGSDLSNGNKIGRAHV